MLKIMKNKGEEIEGHYAWYYISPDTVLYILEQAGMLPPCREHSECPIECIDYCDFDWQPEDDSLEDADEK